jgi:hypothetical protein
MVLLLVFVLFTKHFVVDFPMQVPYHYLNKGTYGHLGGMSHAALHGLGTLFVLMLFPIEFTVCSQVAVADALVHYHIDWAKMNLNKKMGWAPLTSEKFWWLLGLDQYLHALTYIGIVLYLI